MVLLWGNPGLAGFSGIIRDSNRIVVHVISGLVGICDSTKVEATAQSMGLRELKSLGAVGGTLKGAELHHVPRNQSSLADNAKWSVLKGIV